jgi:hypothetical protein
MQNSYRQKLVGKLAKIYCYLVQFNVSADGHTDAEIKFHFTLHPRYHTHIHRSDSRCNPLAQIWERLHHFSVHVVFIVHSEEEEVHGYSVSCPRRPSNWPSPADP